MKNFKELRENQVLSEMAVSRKDFDKIKKNDVIEFVFDSSMKKGHKVKLKVKSKTRSNKYNVDKINMVDATDPRNRTKFTLFSRGGKDATLGWGGMGVVIKSYKIGVKEEVNEDGQYVNPNNMTDKQKQDLKDKQQRERERRIRQMRIGQQDSKDELERKKKERERRLRQYGGKTEAVLNFDNVPKGEHPQFMKHVKKAKLKVKSVQGDRIVLDGSVNQFDVFFNSIKKDKTFMKEVNEAVSRAQQANRNL